MLHVAKITPNGRTVTRTYHVDYIPIADEAAVLGKKGGASGGADFILDTFTIPADDIDVDKHGHVRNVHFYHEDRLIEVKNKIQLITGIPVYRQHLKINKNTTYSVFIYGQQRLVDIDELYKTETRINDIPVDMYLYNNSDGLQIQAHDYFKRVDTTIGDSTKLSMYVYDIEDIMTDRSAIQFKEHMLYGFVLKYFPMITSDVWLDYLSGTDLAAYSRLFPNNEKLWKVVENERELNAEVNARAPRIHFDSFIRFAVIQVEGNTRVDQQALFNALHISDTVLLVSMKKGSTILTKTNKIYPQNIRIVKNELIVLLNTSAGTQNEAAIFLIRIYPTGYYRVEAKWTNLALDFDKLIKLFQKHVNSFIEYVNSFNRTVFQSSFRLRMLNKYNADITSLLIDIYWRHGRYFANIDGALQTLLSAGIIARQIEKDEESKFKFHYSFMKGIEPNYVSLEEFGISSNDYSYATDTRALARWSTILGGRIFSIQNQLSDMKIEINDIKKNEFILFSTYFKHVAAKLLQQPKTTLLPKMRLKKLKEYDPITFDLKRYSLELLYSRMCQQKFQPLIFDKDERSNLSKDQQAKLVEFWNYTTRQPIYYLCDNPKIPYLNFIVNKHPLGICVPCCKKTAATKTKRKAAIYANCIKNKTNPKYQEMEAKAQRYVLNYGKTVEFGRIEQLPQHFLRHITILYPNTAFNYYILGTHEQEVLASSLSALGYIEGKTAREVLLDLHMYLQLHKDLFVYLYDNQLISYFDSVESMLADMLAGSKGKFDDWDRVFIEIAEYVYQTTIFVFRDTKPPDSVQDSNFELEATKPYVSAMYQQYCVLFYYAHYNPVVQALPNRFFNKGEVVSKKYAAEEPLVAVIKDLLFSAEKSGYAQEIDLPFIKALCAQEGYTILSYFVNTRRLIYALMIETPEGNVYFPIAMASADIVDARVDTSAYVNFDSIPYNALRLLIEKANYLIGEKYAGQYHKISIDRLLINNKDGVCGFYQDQNYYFTPVDIEATIDYIKMPYDPNKINGEIIKYLYGSQTNADEETEYERYFRDAHAYDIFVQGFLTLLDEQRNVKVRKQIAALVDKRQFKEIRGMLGNEEADQVIKMDAEAFASSKFSFDANIIATLFEMPAAELRKYVLRVIGKKAAAETRPQFISMLIEDMKNPVKREHLYNVYSGNTIKLEPTEALYIKHIAESLW